jgi:hypothetical protein
VKVAQFDDVRDCSGCFRLERLSGGLAFTGKRRLLAALAPSRVGGFVAGPLKPASGSPRTVEAACVQIGSDRGLPFLPSGVAAGGVHYAGSRKRCQTVDKVSDARGLPETVGCVDARGWNKAAGKQPERANQT